jgi:diacylglycerol kinase family enzyme
MDLHRRGNVAGFGVILNRNAGKGRMHRAGLAKHLAGILGDREALVETGSTQELEAVARTFRERRIEILGIAGGDGSNHFALSAFQRAYGGQPLPLVAFLCGGTHNAHAASIGLRGTPQGLLPAIVGKLRRGQPFALAHRRLLRVDDGVRVHHGFSLATGFMHRFMEEISLRQRDSPLKVAGLLVAWLGSAAIRGSRIKALFALEPARIKIAGLTVPWDRINGMTASGMEKLGLGFTPYPRASETPDTFQVAVSRIQPGVLVGELLGYWRGKTSRNPDQVSGITDQVLLEMESPISYVLDGELYRGSRSLELGCGPLLDLIVG